MSLFDDILENDDELLDFSSTLDVSPPQKQRTPPQTFKSVLLDDEEIENVFNETPSQRRSFYQLPNQRAAPQRNQVHGQCPHLSQVPGRFRSVFPYQKLNRVQSESFDVVFKNDFNTVICAPTSSGKTCLFELAMVRMFNSNRGSKAIYVSPLKALCQERLNDWTNKFGRIGIKVMEVTGDTGNIRVSDLMGGDIIVTTPEKWDSISRRWRESSVNSFLQRVGLFLVDEVHLLNDQRGAVLEVVVCRMLSIMKKCRASGKRCPAANVRLMAISATVPNVEDVAEWLKAPPQGRLNFGEEYRPVPLKKVVVGFRPLKNEFVFLQNLNYKLPDLINRHSDDKPTIVFCSSRKGCENAAKHLYKNRNQLSINLGQVPEARKIKRADLKELAMNGIAFHSAGLMFDDRRTIEDLFLKGKIKIICSTTTLSQGVNLPAHLVIVKGTKVYRRGTGYVEMSQLNIKQMCGRAGRPQFDTHGTAVIMTEQSQRGRYDNLVNNRLIVESHLKDCLIEHLNSEIVLQNITTFNQAFEWLKSTFLYIRARKDPATYGLGANVDEQFRKILQQCFEKLFKYDIIVEKPPNSGRVVATENGKCMSKYYISFNTMVIFSELKGNESLGEILRMSCRSEELMDYNFRLGEKGELNKLKKRVRFPTKDKRVKHVHEKISVLVQCTLQRIKIEKSEMRMQATYILSNILPRIVKAITEYAKKKEFYIAYKNAVLLLKCLERKMWEPPNCQSAVLTQVQGIGDKFARMLFENGLNTLGVLQAANPGEIERITRRNAPFGVNVKTFLSGIDRFQLTVSQKFDQANQKYDLEINVRRVNAMSGGGSYRRGFLLFLGNADNRMLHFRYFHASMIRHNYTFRYSVPHASGNDYVRVSLFGTHFLGVVGYDQEARVDLFQGPVYWKQQEKIRQEMSERVTGSGKKKKKKKKKKKTPKKKSKIEEKMKNSPFVKPGKSKPEPVTSFEPVALLNKYSMNLPDHTKMTPRNNLAAQKMQFHQNEGKEMLNIRRSIGKKDKKRQFKIPDKKEKQFENEPEWKKRKFGQGVGSTSGQVQTNNNNNAGGALEKNRYPFNTKPVPTPLKIGSLGINYPNSFRYNSTRREVTGPPLTQMNQYKSKPTPSHQPIVNQPALSQGVPITNNNRVLTQADKDQFRYKPPAVNQPRKVNHFKIAPGSNEYDGSMFTNGRRTRGVENAIPKRFKQDFSGDKFEIDKFESNFQDLLNWGS